MMAERKSRKSLITEPTMEREDSDVTLPPLQEVDKMTLELDAPASVTFSRNNTWLSNAKDISNENGTGNEEKDDDNRRELFSRAATRNLSRASLRVQSSTRRPERDKRKIVSSADLNFDEEFQWDSDEDEVTTRYSNAAEQHRQRYKQKCQNLGVVPSRKVLNQFDSPVFNASDLNLSSAELSALYVVIINDVDITELNLSGNNLGAKDISHIGEILQTNKSISTLSLRRCKLSGEPVKKLANFLSTSNTLRKLDISENNFDDGDAPFIAQIIEQNESICSLNLSQNRLGDSGVIIGNALKDNEILTTLDLSWNHLRGVGAIGIAKGLMTNTHLLNLQLSWNGFAYEGCAALAHVLVHNTTLSSLDLANNRIHNPAMFELLKGICGNKSLSTIRLAQNPITAPMTSIILQRILDAKECGLKELDIEDVVVDKEFDKILQELQEQRIFMARYGIALPVNKGRVSQIDKKNIFNIDPIRILYFLKENMRTIDMLLKFDQDNSNTLSREELHNAFCREGYPVSSAALDSVMNYLDTNKDGCVDLLRAAIQTEMEQYSDVTSKQIAWELIQGERKLKRLIIAEREEQRAMQTIGPSAKEKKEFSKAFLKPSDVKAPKSPRNKQPELNS